MNTIPSAIFLIILGLSIIFVSMNSRADEVTTCTTLEGGQVTQCQTYDDHSEDYDNIQN